MQRFLFLSILFSLLYIACKKNQTGYNPLPTENDINHLNNFEILQVDYDSLLITSKQDFIISTRFIQKILIGELVNSEIQDADTLLPQYSFLNNEYLVSFTLDKKIEKEKYHYILGIKYLLIDGSFILKQSLIRPYKYPYPSAEIFLPLADVSPDSYVTIIQDFDITSQGLVFHPFGPLGLYFFSFDDHTIRVLEVPGYIGGDYMTADTNYAFSDVNSLGIVRYNFFMDSADLVFDLSQLPFSTGLTDCIRGMDIMDDSLYVLLKNTSNGRIHLVTFNQEGQYQTDFIMSTGIFYLCVDNDILYGYQESGENRYHIIRFDMNNRQLLEPWLSPARKPLGLRIIGNRLYYIDEYRKILCYITPNFPKY